ncbi:nucleotidyltransferase [Paenibacillus wulumuqiensis]|uniref:nucleotidyltransferase n=1 Tax=Paenibacillus wulumuqiensis TaxID=1567107 RepID=UPI0006192B8C|nr:nucleotidyltransferase [Paenibacillus wulumuqiensis]
MKVAGIIVEYNPLHNGHLLHIHKTRELTGCDAVVAVMSGGFTQRGEPAAFSKWARAEMALRCGCDLVIELPSVYVVQPAEWFAYGAVSLLEATGVVDQLVFGSEAGSLLHLNALADLLTDERPEFRQRLQDALKEGLSYPAAVSQAAGAAESISSEAAAMLSEPNNTLGLQYLIALRRLNSSIVPGTIQREKSHYHDPQPVHEQIASATAIRNLLMEQPDRAAAYMPAEVMRIIHNETESGRGPAHINDLWQPLLQTIATATPARLADYYDMNEGLEHRLLSKLTSLTDCSVTGLLDSLKTRRYTYARLQRLIAHLLLGHRRTELTEATLQDGPGYLRVLGFTEHGRQLLKLMKKTSTLPVITRPADTDHPHMEMDIRATVMQASAFASQDARQLYSDYYRAPIRV